MEGCYSACTQERSEMLITARIASVTSFQQRGLVNRENYFDDSEESQLDSISSFYIAYFL